MPRHWEPAVAAREQIGRSEELLAMSCELIVRSRSHLARTKRLIDDSVRLSAARIYRPRPQTQPPVPPIKTGDEPDPP